MFGEWRSADVTRAPLQLLRLFAPLREGAQREARDGSGPPLESSVLPLVGHPRALDQKARFKARTAQLLLAFVVELLPLPRPNLALLLLLAAEALQLCDHGPRMHDPAPQARGWGSQPPPFARARRESVPHVHVRNVPRQGVELLHFGALVGERRPVLDSWAKTEIGGELEL